MPTILTQLQAAIQSGQNEAANVISAAIEASDGFMAALPVVDAPSGVYSFRREEKLASADFRTINADFTASISTISPNLVETKSFGSKLQMDKTLADHQSAGNSDALGGVRAAFEARQARGFGLDFVKKFFKGDSSVTPNNFDGINKLLGSSAQVISAGTNGAVLSEKLMFQLKGLCVGHRPDAYAMSHDMLWELQHLRNSSVQIAMMATEWGTELTTYGGIPIFVIGEDSQGDLILDFNETQGTSSVTGSIYAFRFAPEEYTFMVQDKDMEVLPLPLQSGMYYLTYLNWNCAPVFGSAKSAARLKGILPA